MPLSVRSPTSILTLFTALVFMGSGATKLLGVGGHADNCVRWGYPPWFVPVVGSVEVLGAIVLLIPRFSSLAALGLAVTMVGAITTRLRGGEIAQAIFPCVLLIILSIIAHSKWARLQTFIDRARRQP